MEEDFFSDRSTMGIREGGSAGETEGEGDAEEGVPTTALLLLLAAAEAAVAAAAARSPEESDGATFEAGVIGGKKVGVANVGDGDGECCCCCRLKELFGVVAELSMVGIAGSGKESKELLSSSSFVSSALSTISESPAEGGGGGGGGREEDFATEVGGRGGMDVGRWKLDVVECSDLEEESTRMVTPSAGVAAAAATVVAGTIGMTVTAGAGVTGMTVAVTGALWTGMTVAATGYEAEEGVEVGVAGRIGITVPTGVPGVTVYRAG